MNILDIGAHPDDIEFGCGGSLLRYSEMGHNIYLFVLTDGGFGGDAEIRKKEQRRAADFLKTKLLLWGNLRDTEVGFTRELILKIEEVIGKVSPDVVFINYPDDVHQDHRALAQAGISATRYLKEVLFFEVPTTHNFEPNIFIDITGVLDKKLELLRLHVSQIDKTKVKCLTILESATSCANFRGYQGRVKFAEGFKALRVLKDIN